MAVRKKAAEVSVCWSHEGEVPSLMREDIDLPGIPALHPTSTSPTTGKGKEAPEMHNRHGSADFVCAPLHWLVPSPYPERSTNPGPSGHSPFLPLCCQRDKGLMEIACKLLSPQENATWRLPNRKQISVHSFPCHKRTLYPVAPCDQDALLSLSLLFHSLPHSFIQKCTYPMLGSPSHPAGQTDNKINSKKMRIV